MLAEPSVALTDYALVAACAVFSLIIWRSPLHRLRPWALLFFITIGLGAAFGGTAHGFAPNERSLRWRILWAATMFSLGATAYALCGLSAALACLRSTERLAAYVCALLFALYALAIVLLPQPPFLLAVVAYAPALVWLAISLVRRWSSQLPRMRIFAWLGIGLSVLAALLQQRLIDLSAIINHNVAYHLVQCVGLLFLCWWIRLECSRPDDRKKVLPTP